MRRLLPLLGLLLLLLLAAGAALLVLSGRDDGSVDGGGRVGDGGAGPISPGEHARRERERTVQPGRVRGAVRLLTEDRAAAGVVVRLVNDDGDALTAASGDDGGFEFPSVASGAVWELSIDDGTHAPVARPGLVVQPRTTLEVGTLYLASGVPVIVEVRAVDGQPLAGATAAAYVTGTGSATFDLPHAARSVATAITDANGEARFPALPPGGWTLTAQKPSYARRGLPNVIVRAGVPEERFRIVLERGYSLTGRVIDREGNGVAGAPMLAIRRTLTSDASTAPLAVRTESEADGRYRLDGLPAQDVVVWAGWPGERMGVLAAVRLPGVSELDIVLVRGGRLVGRITTADTKTPVAGATVSAGLSILGSFSLAFEDVTDDDGEYAFTFPMPGAVDSLSAAAAGHGEEYASLGEQGEIHVPEGFTARRDFSLGEANTVSGVVRGPDGPVRGVTVGATNPSWWTDTTTDASGRYELGGLVPGRYVILASLPGLVMPDRPADPDGDLVAGTAPERYVADLTAGGPVVIDFDLVAGPGIAGRVVNEDGDPIEGATVTVSTGGAVSDADGRFVIPGPGQFDRFFATVAHPDYRTVSAEAPWTPEGEDPADFTVEMTRAPIVRGIVTDVGGRVPEGTYVQIGPWSSDLRDPLSDEWSWLSGPRHPVGRDGRFEQRLNEEGVESRIVVRAGAPGFAVASTGPLPTPTDGPLEVTLTLQTGVSIRGRVETADGAPVPRANVSAAAVSADTAPESLSYPGAWGAPIVAVADADGRFTMSALRDGRFVLRAWSREHLEERIAVDAPADDVVIQLGVSLVIAGDATMVDGTPVTGARIEAASDDGETWKQTRVGEDGTFRIAELPPGAYRITLSPASDDRQNLRTVVVEGVAAGTQDLALRTTPGRILRGVIVTADGGPTGVSSLSVERNLEREDALESQTDPSGRFSVVGLDDGPYRLVVWSEALGGVGNGVFDGVRPGEAEVQFRLPSAAEMRGVLVGPGGEPMPEVTISFAVGDTEPDGRIAPFELSCETDAEGRFVLQAAAGVTYRPYLGDHASLGLPADATARAGRGEVRLVAGTGVELRGRVVDDTGTPIPDASVWASAEYGNRSATSGADGSFHVTGLAESASYSVYASGNGYISSNVMTEPGREDVEIRLERAAAFAGRVIDRTGMPYGGVQINVARLPRDGTQWSGWIDEDGSFEVNEIPRGRFEVHVMDPDGEMVPCGEAESGSTDIVVHFPR